MKKNERISVITKILSDHPNEVFSYNYFTDLLAAGKSSVCEDVAIVKNAIELTGTGYVETYSGASGGVVYHPQVTSEE